MGYETFVDKMASEMRELERLANGMDWSTDKKLKNKVYLKMTFLQKLCADEKMYFHHSATELEVEPSAEQDLTEEDFPPENCFQ